MNAILQTLFSSVDQNFEASRLSRFSAGEIREAVSGLLASDQQSLADALCEAGLSLYPRDENMLAIASLMANFHEDWVRAEGYIRDLIDLHHGRATAFTWHMLVRNLRCQLEPIEALKAARQGLAQHPDSSDLLRESQELIALFGEASVLIPAGGTS